MTINTMDRATTAIAVVAGSILLMAASAALGTVYGYQSGAHYHPYVGIVFAGAALGGELLKPFAVRAAVEALLRLDLVRATVCAMLAVVCIAYSLASELGLSATSRGDLAAERAATSDHARSDKGQRDRAEATLAQLKPTRPVAELEALIKRTPPSRSCAVENGSGKLICRVPPHPLEAELGRAKERQRLEATIAGGGNSPVMAQKEADPLASAVVAYLAIAGYAVDPKVIAVLLYLVPVLLLEVGSGFSLLVLPKSTVPATSSPAAEEIWELQLQETTPALLPATVSAPERIVGNVFRLENVWHPVLAALEAAGRPLTNGELAAAMQVSDGEASKRWREVAHLVHAERRGRELAIRLL